MKNESAKRMKGLCKIVSIISKISSIFIIIAGIFMIITMSVMPVIISNIKVTDNNITIFKHTYNYQITESKITIDNKVITNNVCQDLINEFQEHSKVTIISIIEFVLATVVVTLILIYRTLINAYKLFKNIAEGYTPFTENNIKHIKSIAKCMLIAVIVSAIGGSAFEMVSNYSFGLNINLIEIIAILILFSLAYIFEYGYKLQQEIDATL